MREVVEALDWLTVVPELLLWVLFLSELTPVALLLTEEEELELPLWVVTVLLELFAVEVALRRLVAEVL